MFVPQVNFANIEVLKTYFEDDPFVEVKDGLSYVKVVDTETNERAFWVKGPNGFLTFDSSNAKYSC